MTPWRFGALLAGEVALLLTGCTGRPGRVPQPIYQANAGAAAVKIYDANGDGVLGGAELDRVPALRASLEQVDRDGDGRLTAQEIDARIKSWQSSRVGEMSVRCEVLLDGASLPSAQVVFEPEPFLGSNVKPASGVTTNSGTGGISLAREDLADPRYAGVACGWYKIRVTSAERELPTRYNTETTLGCEVAMNAGWVNRGAVEISLQSR